MFLGFATRVNADLRYRYLKAGFGTEIVVIRLGKGDFFRLKFGRPSAIRCHPVSYLYQAISSGSNACCEKPFPNALSPPANDPNLSPAFPKEPTKANLSRGCRSVKSLQS